MRKPFGAGKDGAVGILFRLRFTSHRGRQPGGESRTREATIPRGQIGDNRARFRVVGGCPPTTDHPIKMGLIVSCCPGSFGCGRLITQRSQVQILPTIGTRVNSRSFFAAALGCAMPLRWRIDAVAPWSGRGSRGNSRAVHRSSRGRRIGRLPSRATAAWTTRPLAAGNPRWRAHLVGAVRVHPHKH